MLLELCALPHGQDVVAWHMQSSAVCVLQVWTWGEPWGDFSMNVNRHPRPVPGATNIAKIACGAFHNLAFSWYV